MSDIQKYLQERINEIDDVMDNQKRNGVSTLVNESYQKAFFEILGLVVSKKM